MYPLLCSLTVHALRRRGVLWFTESWVYFCVGLVLGLVEVVASSPRLSEISNSLHSSFAQTFFVLLLPTVCFFFNSAMHM